MANDTPKWDEVDKKTMLIRAMRSGSLNRILEKIHALDSHALPRKELDRILARLYKVQEERTPKTKVKNIEKLINKELLPIIEIAMAKANNLSFAGVNIEEVNRAHSIKNELIQYQKNISSLLSPKQAKTKSKFVSKVKSPTDLDSFLEDAFKENQVSTSTKLTREQFIKQTTPAKVTDQLFDANKFDVSGEEFDKMVADLDSRYKKEQDQRARIEEVIQVETSKEKEILDHARQLVQKRRNDLEIKINMKSPDAGKHQPEKPKAGFFEKVKIKMKSKKSSKSSVELLDMLDFPAEEVYSNKSQVENSSKSSKSKRSLASLFKPKKHKTSENGPEEPKLGEHKSKKISKKP